MRSKPGSAPRSAYRRRRSETPRTPISAVAELARVSNATVSRVVNGQTGKVSEATRARVQDAVRKLNYTPSRAGSALRSGRSQMVALVLPDRFNSYNQGLAAALEKAVRQSGKVMVLCTTDESPDKQDAILHEMRSQLACGIVILGAVASPGLRKAIAEGEPVVLVNRRFNGRMRAPFVGVDNAPAAARVADELVARGVSSVGVFHGPVSSSATAERLRGFRERYQALAPRAKLESFALSTFSKEEGYARAASLLAAGRRMPTIFCTSDEIAYGVARAYREAGIVPGRDLTLFGFDGSPINEYLTPWLNTVQVDCAAYGPAIVGLLQGYWADRPPKPSAEILVSYRLSLAEDDVFEASRLGGASPS